jgi:hypothetical protein
MAEVLHAHWYTLRGGAARYATFTGALGAAGGRPAVVEQWWPVAVGSSDVQLRVAVAVNDGMPRLLEAA